MATSFKRKILKGIDIVSEAVKSWCSSTFAPKTHSHTKYEVSGITPFLPAYSKRTRLIATRDLNTALSFRWTADVNCWIRIFARGDSQNCGSKHEHMVGVVLSSTYDSSSVTDYQIYECRFSRDFYRSDITSIVPIRKGDSIRIVHSCDHSTTQLGFDINIEKILISDWAHV